MKVKIGNLEITVESLEELDSLVQRYGANAAAEGGAQKSNQAERKLPNAGAADSVLLNKFVEAGGNGVTTIDVGTILGRQGKAARPALKEWAKRVGLTNDDNLEVFEEARVGTQRGVRLKSSLLDVAKHLLNQK
jgi:hypothetical protein